MSLSRSAANLRQLRHARTAEADVPSSKESDSGFAATDRQKPQRIRHSAASEEVTHSLRPLKPLVAWEETDGSVDKPVTWMNKPPRSSLSEAVWPPPDFSRTELPKLGTTQIMAVRIDRSGAPLGAAQGKGKSSDTASSMLPTKKVKTRGVTLGGWRNGVTAVKFSSQCHCCSCRAASVRMTDCNNSVLILCSEQVSALGNQFGPASNTVLG